MKIIDSHVHFSNIEVFKDTARLYSRVDYSREGFIKECEECGVEKAVCMGLAETGKHLFPDENADTPMLADLGAIPGQMYVCPGVNPHRLDITALESFIKRRKAVGIKIYAGYYHFDVCDKIYEPVYHLAQLYNIPVVLHSGDTYSDRGLLKYSHPLCVDQLAVTHRGVRFVIAHLGDPWIIDACEVAYKNRNVFLDMSGLIVGGADDFAAVETSRYTQGIKLLNNYKKLLFGTDWPLAPMKEYIEFCKRLVPEQTYLDVFYNNASEVFKLGGLNE